MWCSLTLLSLPRGFAPRTPPTSAFARSATASPRRSLGVGGPVAWLARRARSHRGPTGRFIERASTQRPRAGTQPGSSPGSGIMPCLEAAARWAVHTWRISRLERGARRRVHPGPACRARPPAAAAPAADRRQASAARATRSDRRERARLHERRALPRAEAFAVKDGRFVAVGSTSDIRNLATRRTQVIDAQRMTVTPGFIDAHCHPSGVQRALRRQHQPADRARDPGGDQEEGGRRRRRASGSPASCSTTRSSIGR